MSEQPFTLDFDGERAVATVELGRPQSGNRLTSGEIATLGRAIRDAGCRAAVKLVVVRAQGEAFCLGRAPGEGPPPADALGIRSEVTDKILSLYADVRATDVPVLAIVQGPALGFGSAFVGVCDLAIAAEEARFAFTEMAQNLPPTLAMSAVLQKLPYKRLMHMVLTQEQISGAQAHALGLVSEVVPRERLQEAAAATIAKLIDRDRTALCTVKDYQLRAWNLDDAAAARLGANMLSVVLSSQR